MRENNTVKNTSSVSNLSEIMEEKCFIPTTASTALSVSYLPDCNTRKFGLLSDCYTLQWHPRSTQLLNEAALINCWPAAATLIVGTTTDRSKTRAVVVRCVVGRVGFPKFENFTFFCGLPKPCNKKKKSHRVCPLPAGRQNKSIHSSWWTDRMGRRL